MKKIVLPGIIAGILALLAGMLLSLLFSAIFPSVKAEYMTGLFRPWSDPLMILFLLYPFITGVALAWFWDKAKGIMKGKSIWQKGLSLATIYLVIATIPGMFMTYTSFNISLLMVLTWAVSGFINVFIIGAVLAKMNK